MAFPVQPLPMQDEKRDTASGAEQAPAEAKASFPATIRRLDDRSHLAYAGAGARRAAQEGIFRNRTCRRASRRHRAGARAQRLRAGNAGARPRHGASVGCAAGKGEGGPLEGLPLGIKDLFCTAGVRTTACSHILENFVPTYESTVTANLWRDGAVLLGKLNNDEFAMGSSNETSYFGPVVSPWRRRGVGRKARARRLVGRFGGGGRGRSVRRRDRHRYRRLDPPAGGVLRHRRTKADLWPLLALGHRGVRVLARSGRAVRAHRARLRDPAALDGRARRQGHDLRRSAGAGLREGRRRFGQRHAHRHSQGIPHAGHGRGDRDAVAARRRNGSRTPAPRRSRFRCRTTKYALPAYYIVAPAEASSNLARYDGVRYGLRVPGRDIIDMYERTRAAGFGKEVRRRIMIGTYVLSAGYYDAYYLRAQKVRTLIKRDFERCFADGIDAILTPTTPSAAFAIGEKGRADPIEMYLNDVFTVTVNMAGLAGHFRAGRPRCAGSAARPAADRPAVRGGDVVRARRRDRAGGGTIFAREVVVGVIDSAPASTVRLSARLVGLRADHFRRLISLRRRGSASGCSRCRKAISFSRTSQRKSQIAAALLALTRCAARSPCRLHW